MPEFLSQAPIRLLMTISAMLSGSVQEAPCQGVRVRIYRIRVYIQQTPRSALECAMLCPDVGPRVALQCPKKKFDRPGADVHKESCLLDAA